MNSLLFLTRVKDLEKRTLNSVVDVSQGRRDEGKHLGSVRGSFGTTVTNHPVPSNSPVGAHDRGPCGGGCLTRLHSAAFALCWHTFCLPSLSAGALVYTGAGKGFLTDLMLGIEQPCKPFSGQPDTSHSLQRHNLFYTPPIMAHTLEVKHFSSKILHSNQR